MWAFVPTRLPLSPVSARAAGQRPRAQLWKMARLPDGGATAAPVLDISGLAVVCSPDVIIFHCSAKCYSL